MRIWDSDLIQAEQEITYAGEASYSELQPRAFGTWFKD
jgi:hypothetical protein